MKSSVATSPRMIGSQQVLRRQWGPIDRLVPDQNPVGHSSEYPAVIAYRRWSVAETPEPLPKTFVHSLPWDLFQRHFKDLLPGLVQHHSESLSPEQSLSNWSFLSEEILEQFPIAPG